VLEGVGNVPIEVATAPDFLNVAAVPGASRYRCLLHDDRPIDALLLNRESEFLVVSLHGAVDRAKVTPPFFAHLDALMASTVSSIHFGDPTLGLSDALSVGWYVGWPGFNCYEVIAEWSVQAAECIGASYVIFVGCGAGGYAALQCATYLPQCTALAFNPDTRICAEESDFSSGPGQEDSPFSLVGDRMSVVDRYQGLRKNGVVIVQNRMDANRINEHYLPLKAIRPPRDSTPQTRYLEYDDPAMLVVPDSGVFARGLECAMTVAAGPDHSRTWPFLI